MDHGTAPESVREFIETGVGSDRIADVKIRPVQLNSHREGRSLSMDAEVEVFVLFGIKQGGMSSLHHKMTVSHVIPVSDHWEYECDVWVSRPRTAVAVDGGLEISFTMEFSWAALEEGMMEGIERVMVEEVKEEKRAPSVIVRAVQEGECIWDIAKAYRTVTADIIRANALSSDEVYSGQMLMIPKQGKIS